MKQSNQRRNWVLFLKANAYILLLFQLSISTVPYCDWLFHDAQEICELVKSESSETEFEDNKKDKEHTVKMSFLDLNYKDALNLDKSWSIRHLTSIHKADISTPPPEIFFS